MQLSPGWIGSGLNSFTFCLRCQHGWGYSITPHPPPDESILVLSCDLQMPRLESTTSLRYGW